LIPWSSEFSREHCANCCHEKAIDGMKLRLSNVPKALEKIGVPPKFVGTCFEFPARLSEYLSPEMKRGFFISGTTGVGKTTWLTLFLERWMVEHAKRGKDSIPWRFENGAGLMMSVQRAFKRDNEDAYEILDAVAEVPFLAIDDLGATKATDFVRQAIYYIINERESWGRPTFITSNFSLSELNDQFDPRISSRIAGMCDVIELKGKDRRIVK
jgi:DNA replication protein DnaC